MISIKISLRFPAKILLFSPIRNEPLLPRDNFPILNQKLSLKLFGSNHGLVSGNAKPALKNR